MLLHYLAFALRSFGRDRLSAAVGVLSLALGMFCLIAAYLFVDYLRGGERIFENSERIHVIYQGMTLPFGAEIPLSPMSSAPLAEYLGPDFPELEAVARAEFASPTVVSSDGRNARLDVMAADPSFLEIFDLPFIARSAQNPLGEPRGAVIAESAAIGLFGSADVLGRSISVGDGLDFTVAGVVAEIPAPSHLARSFLWDGFEILVPWDTWRGAPDARSGPAWLSYYGGLFTYVLLPESGSLTVSRLNARLGDFGDRHVPPEVATARFEARPVSRVLPDFYQAIYAGERLGGVSVTTVLFWLGGLALVIACINFVNLSIAATVRRAKEIGMRKTLGASPADVARQHLVEVLCVAAIALVIAAAAVAACRLLIAYQWGIDVPSPYSRPGIIAFLLGVLATAAFAAGIYPAVARARVEPIFALRAGAPRAGARGLRATLIGVQFAAASALLVAVIVMQQQNAALRATPLIEDAIVMTSSPGEAGLDPGTFETELLRSPAIRGVTATDFEPWAIGFGGGTVRRSPDPSEHGLMMQHRFVGHDYFQTLGIRALAGRLFSKDYADDLAAMSAEEAAARRAPVNVIIDHRAAEAFGWADPTQAVGQRLYAGDTAVEIIGIVEDRPLTLVALSNVFMYRLRPELATIPLIRISRNDIPAALARIDEVWRSLAPEFVPEREFVDTKFEGAYALFEGGQRVFGALASFAVLIAATGLFSVASDVTSRRRSEIGIRKVHGATSLQALTLLLREFAIPVVIAQLIAWPVAYLACRAYVNLFVERTDLNVVPFVTSFALMALIAFAAVARQSLSASRQSPALVLRHE